jgi:D-hexose-6-phosphate mutarotase
MQLIKKPLSFPMALNVKAISAFGARLIQMESKGPDDCVWHSESTPLWTVPIIWNSK